MSGAEIVAALRHDRTAGFEALYSDYAERLYAYATTVMQDSTAAADVTHDALIRAVTRIDQLRDPERLEPWLFAITRNECFKALRARARVVDDQDAITMQSTVDDADRDLAAADSQALVQDALSTLSAADRDVLALALRHDLDTTQVAEAMQTSPNQVRARLSRARTALTSAVTALLLARDTTASCRGLADALAGYDGRLSPLLRKRVARHARDCADCEARGNRRALAYVSGFSLPVVAILPRGFEARAAESVANLGTPAIETAGAAGDAGHAANVPAASQQPTARWGDDSPGNAPAAHGHGSPGLPWAARTAGVVAAGLALVVGAGLWQRGEIPLTDPPQPVAQSVAGADVREVRELPFEGGPDGGSARSAVDPASNGPGTRSDGGTGQGRPVEPSGNESAQDSTGADGSAGQPQGGQSQGGGSPGEPADPDLADSTGKEESGSGSTDGSGSGGSTAEGSDKPATDKPDDNSSDPPAAGPSDTKPPTAPSPVEEKQPDPKQPDPEPKQPDPKQPDPEPKQPDPKQPEPEPKQPEPQPKPPDVKEPAITQPTVKAPELKPPGPESKAPADTTASAGTGGK